MSDERNLFLVREMLNRDGIKLWLAPYTVENDSVGKYSQEFLDRYSTKLGLDTMIVVEILEQLRNNALQKLKSKEKYQGTGIATLKVKIMKNQLIKNNEKQVFFIETSLKVYGSDLRAQVSSKCNVSSELIKLISSGIVIDDNQTLEHQKLKNNGVLMVLILPQSKGEASEESNQLSLLKSIREDAELLLGNKDDTRLQITDQHGKAMDIPKEERNALGVAMTLNEKGRSFLKKKDYTNALMFLLEADKEFKCCSSDILNMVDNYALVCLDIVWCYLCLRSINDLPDAERRLKVCEECFRRSYGDNFERLMIIKGTVGDEAALFARLHLLQGVLAFHQNRIFDANHYFCKVGTELAALQIDDDKLCEIIALGYSVKEARLGLRNCNGNISMAVSYIIKKKEERKEIRMKEKENRKKKMKEKLLGVTEGGETVNFQFFQSMLNMGFDTKAAKSALQKSNNNISLALQLMDENPEMMSCSNNVPADNTTAEMIVQLCNLGYDYDTAHKALQRTQMNVHEAIDMLVETGGIIPGASNSDIDQKEMEAVERLAPDIAEDEDDHLDITLDEERQFLNEYRELLNQSSSNT